MTLAELKNMVDEALETQNPAIVADCEGYYSPYYQLFYLLACHFEKATPMGSPLFVELGVDKGRGSFSMLQGWATVIGVEQNDKECFSMSHPNLTLLKCSSTPVPKAIADRGKAIQVLHIDTEHSFAQAREEFNAYRPHLKDGAVVLFDDTNAMEGEVRRFVESLPYEKFFDDRLHESCGYGGIIYREGV
jgi:hypothetical protein